MAQKICSVCGGNDHFSQECPELRESKAVKPMRSEVEIRAEIRELKRKIRNSSKSGRWRDYLPKLRSLRVELGLMKDEGLATDKRWDYIRNTEGNVLGEE